MNRAKGTAVLDKTFDILEAIGLSSEGLDNQQLAAQLSLPRATLYRLLALLVERGMVRRDANNKCYRLGFRYLELVRGAWMEPDLIAAASFELRALRDLTGETTYLAIRDGDQVLSLERCDGAHSRRSAASMGQRKAMYCTGQGKAILSALGDEERRELVKHMTLTPLTPLTITDRNRLQTELDVTRVRGYAIDDEEIVLGVRCVAAPVVDSSGQVRGALSIAGPAYRLTLERLTLLGPEVAASAQRVGSQLAVKQAEARPDELQPVSSQWAFLGGHPRWSSGENCLYWADKLGPAVYRHGPEGTVRILRTEKPIMGLEITPNGLFVALEDVYFLYEKGEVRHRTPWGFGTPTCLCCDREGRVWASIRMGSGQWKVGEVSRDGTLISHWQISEAISALCWDSPRQQLFALAPESGSLYRLRAGAEVRRFTSMPKGSGQLSGLAVDGDGSVWTALSGGWSIVKFDHEGNLERMLGVPVASPTDLCFGAVDGRTLFVTSSRQAVSRQALKNAPWSGTVMSTPAGSHGAPAPLTRGPA
ncbi:IclR family transcriptional regulator [Pseudomonas jessenii]|uniref:HTH-type transcriptional repressor AllR n=1 Tax=Pseudomonas jessenii TaxID=77298 RepID=A0A2W0EVH2_PSEJE|nr:IclR family transcriptional regulator C-terminal domain-containing protein [Pseudomonas jessenii]PYY72423.1 IclR family transcriptional regulator [Pseudomonas jessenii]